MGGGSNYGEGEEVRGHCVEAEEVKSDCEEGEEVRCVRKAMYGEEMSECGNVKG